MESIKQMEPRVRETLEKALTTVPEPSDSTSPQTSSCPECQDTGFVQRGGKNYRCRCRIEAAIRYQLPARYHAARIDDFPPAIAKAVTEWLDKPTDGLLLSGAVGSGKTHLAAGIVRCQISRGKRTIFRRAAVMFQALRDSYGSGQSEESVLQDYLEAPMLVLDDLGAGSLSDHERRCTLEVLDCRLNALLPTVVTTNWTLQEIAERMDERVASRLASFKRLDFKGEDKRAR